MRGELEKKYAPLDGFFIVCAPLVGVNVAMPKVVQRAIKQLANLRSQAAASLQALQRVDISRAGFFKYLDEPPKKINDFYKAEAQEVQRRVDTLREQSQALA